MKLTKKRSKSGKAGPREKTFIVKGEEISNLTFIAEEFNNFVVEIGKSVSDSVPPHIDSFHTHLKDNYLDNFFIQPSDVYEIKSVVQKLNAVRVLTVYLQN